MRVPRIGLVHVSGVSMAPTLADGDWLLVAHGRSVREADLVVARFPDDTVAVKRAHGRRTSRSGAAAWWLLSDNPDRGVDSRHRGPVSEGDVMAVVVARVWPRPVRL